MATPAQRQLPDNLSLERVLSAKQGADFVGLSVSQFRRQQWAGKLPPAIQLSTRRVGWKVRDLIEHLEKCRGGA
jgi:predicted DNA-binding transcriptional regulator AlpA